MIVYWEDDDTGAKDDAKVLQTAFKNLLGVEPTMWTIRNVTSDPYLPLREKITDIQVDKLSPTSPLPVNSLFIFAYIGHGGILTIRHKPELVFDSKKPGRNIRWTKLQECFELPQTSTLAILDCCKSGLRGTSSLVTPAIQVLAACAGNENARSRGTVRVTLTRRICGELELAEKRGETFINTEELFQRLKILSALDSPSIRLHRNGGVRPIILKLKKQPKPTPTPAPRASSPSRNPRPRPPPKRDAQHVVVRLTLTGPEAENMGDLQDWIMRMPTPFHVRLIDAFKTTNSSLVLMRMEWQTWARLSTVLDLDPICVITGESLLRRSILVDIPALGEEVQG